MADAQLTTVPAGHGKAARLTSGQKLKLINTHGTQVVDFWAFNAYDLGEYMDVASSRVWNLHLWPKVGDVMVTNQRRPIVKLVEDTTPGIHDTIMSACDRHRYGLLGVKGYHRNFQDNMFEGMLELGAQPPFPIPGSWNTFMNIPLKEDRYTIDIKPTVSKPGQYIVLQAQMDCYMAFSACPQDILPIHGEGGKPPRDCQFQILD